MKKKTSKIILVIPVLLILATVIDCGGGGGGNPPTTGFYIQAVSALPSPFGPNYVGTSFSTDWLTDNGSAQGQTRHYEAFTSPGAYAHVDDGRVPARWRIFSLIGLLPVTQPEWNVTANQHIFMVFLQPVSFLAANPDSIDLASPPPVVTISGGGFDATYGMPVVEYYDQYSGGLVGSATAFSVAGDGSYLQVYTPDISGTYTGTYNVVVSNINSDGSYSPAGLATFSACCVDPGPPPPPPDPPGCGEGGICEIQ